MSIKPMHVVLGAAGLGALYLLLKPKTAAAASSSAAANTTPAVAPAVPAFNAQGATNVILDPMGKSVSVAPGSSLTFSNAATGQTWSGAGIVSSNPAVVASSGGSNFVSVQPGTAVITATYVDSAGATQKVSATIVVAAPVATVAPSSVLNVVLDPAGKTMTVKQGTGLSFSNAFTDKIWSGAGVVSSDPTIIAPVAGSYSNFLAASPGTTLITGYYTDANNELQRAMATITVTA